MNKLWHRKQRNLLQVGNIQNFGPFKFSLDHLNLVLESLMGPQNISWTPRILSPRYPWFVGLDKCTFKKNQCTYAHLHHKLLLSWHGCSCQLTSHHTTNRTTCLWSHPCFGGRWFAGLDETSQLIEPDHLASIFACIPHGLVYSYLVSSHHTANCATRLRFDIVWHSCFGGTSFVGFDEYVSAKRASTWCHAVYQTRNTERESFLIRLSNEKLCDSTCPRNNFLIFVKDQR